MTTLLAMSQDVVLFALGVLLILFLATERFSAWLVVTKTSPSLPRASRRAPRAPSDPKRLQDL